LGTAYFSSTIKNKDLPTFFKFSVELKLSSGLEDRVFFMSLGKNELASFEIKLADFFKTE